VGSYPFILLNLILSFWRHSARHHDEPEPAGPERSRAERTGLRRESPREAEIQAGRKLNLLGISGRLEICSEEAEGDLQELHS